jgi:hypothetical protein
VIDEPLPSKSPRKALILELACGLGGVYGIGNIWVERTERGLIGMVGFWLVSLTAGCLVGAASGRSESRWLVGYALTWLLFAVPMARSAVQGAKEFNSRWAASDA